ncbi:hypothetical protein XENOCAPTIV_006108 [Xenoophorus captivus]|uniref:Uncharacterized protein n=1 Tax=Xenoophorus captivus TaxID=1517983 RepID=A0ABV0RQH5_9TELE
MFVRASNLEFQTHEEEWGPTLDLQGREAEPPSMEVNDGRMARISNYFSVLLLAQILQPGMAGAAFGDTNDAALQGFGLMFTELGHLLATLVVTRRQVWLAQSPISYDCRQSLRSLPLVPGQLFGPKAERALECRQQSSQASEV